jgi:hypothetical protein
MKTEQDYETEIPENQRQDCCVYRGSPPRRKFNSMPGANFPPGWPLRPALWNPPAKGLRFARFSALYRVPASAAPAGLPAFFPCQTRTFLSPNKTPT